MLKGYLRIFVLKELMEGARSGYALMKSIGEATGKRPSPGSLYPLLKDMADSGMIVSGIKGEKPRYSITRRGRSAISRFLKEKEALIAQHLKICRSVRAIGGADSVKVAGQGEVCKGVFERNFDLVQDLREILTKAMTKRESRKNEQEARRILQRAIKDLRRVPWGS